MQIAYRCLFIAYFFNSPNIKKIIKTVVAVILLKENRIVKFGTYLAYIKK